MEFINCMMIEQSFASATVQVRIFSNESVFLMILLLRLCHFARIYGSERVK